MSPSSDRSEGGNTPPPDAADWPIPLSELAERVGMTPRNIRAHQSRGLLPPPIRHGRVACYGPEHERILLRIKELQAKGYNLVAITALLSEPGDERVALQRLVLAPLLEPDDVVISRDEMTAMFGVSRDAHRLKLALDSGLLADVGEDHFRMGSRNVLEASRRLTELGMPILELFEMQLQVTESTRDLARRFVETSLRCALEPYGANPQPEHWENVRARFDQLSRLTAGMLAAVFTLNVRRATEQYLSEQQLPVNGQTQ